MPCPAVAASAASKAALNQILFMRLPLRIFNCRINNLFLYCQNNPIRHSDATGCLPDDRQIQNAAIYSAGGNIAMCGYSNNIRVTSTINTYALAQSLPPTGEPNSTQTLNNPDGTPKQKRWYGPDGRAEWDRDYNHPGDMPFPHDHEWTDGNRSKDHLPPSPNYNISWDLIIGVGLTSICLIGVAIVLADDITVVGIADDFLLVPVCAGLDAGLVLLCG